MVHDLLLDAIFPGHMKKYIITQLQFYKQKLKKSA